MHERCIINMTNGVNGRVDMKVDIGRERGGAAFRWTADSAHANLLRPQLYRGPCPSSSCSRIPPRVRGGEGFVCAPGTDRTCDIRFRKPALYPLSYGSPSLVRLIASEKFSATTRRAVTADAPRGTATLSMSILHSAQSGRPSDIRKSCVSSPRGRRFHRRMSRRSKRVTVWNGSKVQISTRPAVAGEASSCSSPSCSVGGKAHV